MLTLRLVSTRRAIISAVLVAVVGFCFLSVPAQAQDTPWAGKTVRVLSWGKDWLFPPLIKDGVKQPLLTNFEKETGITVEFILLDEGSVRQKAILDMTSHTGQYDIIGIGSWPLGTYAPYLQPLDDYLQKYVNTKYFQPQYFTASTRRANSYNGKLYSLPIYNHAGALVYRKDLFEKYNIKVPRTIEELAEAAKKLTLDTDGDGQIDIYGIAGRARKGEEPAIIASGFAWAYGGTWFEGNPTSGPEIKAMKAKPAFDSPEFIAGIKAYVNLLRNYGPPGEPNFSWVESAGAVAAGKAAMHIGFSSGYWYIRQNAKIDPSKFAIALAPVGPAVHRIQCYWNFSLGINKDSQEKLAAWQVLQLLASRQMQMALVKDGTITVPDYDLLRTDVAKAQYPPEDLETVINALQIAEPEYMPRFPEMARIRDLLGTVVSEAVAGQITVEEGMKSLQKEALKIMTEAGYYK